MVTRKAGPSCAPVHADRQRPQRGAQAGRDADDAVMVHLQALPQLRPQFPGQVEVLGTDPRRALEQALLHEVAGKVRLRRQVVGPGLVVGGIDEVANDGDHTWDVRPGQIQAQPTQLLGSLSHSLLPVEYAGVQHRSKAFAGCMTRRHRVAW